MIYLYIGSRKRAWGHPPDAAARRGWCNPAGCRPIPPHFFALIQRRPVATSPDVRGAAEGGCCTPGALCVVASCTSFASGQARSLSRFAAPPSPCKGKPLHGNPCSKKASQTPKGNPLCYRIPRPRNHTAGYRILQGRTD